MLYDIGRVALAWLVIVVLVVVILVVVVLAHINSKNNPIANDYICSECQQPFRHSTEGWNIHEKYACDTRPRTLRR